MEKGKDVKTIDGRIVNSYSEEWRCHTEAKWVFKKFRSKRTRQEYLAQVWKNRGQAGYDQLYAEMLRIHNYKKESEKND